MDTRSGIIRAPVSALFVFLFAMQFAIAADAQDAPTISFNREIRPILADRCFRCHGPDADARESEMRLDIREDAIDKAFTPGDSFASRLIDRITDDDPEKRMPPPEMGDALTEPQIELLADWIDEGATYEQHWSYVSPKRPKLPDVQNADWCVNPIDRFVLARLEEKGYTPSSDATPANIVRRLHFDILGLPATPKNRDQYGTTTHESYVDQLLTSPHYGERMAIGWLDLVRYADSTGYHGDEFWDMYPYRDYVINAFNNNKPFDTFTIEQLAGDLLPGATEEQQIATAYNRLNQVTTEGGANREEYRIKYASDRARTTASTWLGATIGCAECHDHKFDPISMRDFYSFTAFFADVEDPGTYMPGQHYPPFLELPTEDQTANISRLTKAIADARSHIQAVTPELETARAEWEKELRSDIRARDDDWTVANLIEAQPKNETTLTITESGTVLASGEIPLYDVYTVKMNTTLPRITGIRLEVLDHPNYFRKERVVAPTANYKLSEIEVKHGQTIVPLAAAEADIEAVNQNGPASAIDHDLQTGWAPALIFHPGPHQIVFTFAEAIDVIANRSLEVALHFDSIPFNQIEHFRLSLTSTDNPRLGPRDGIPSNVAEFVLQGKGKRSPIGERSVLTYYQSIAPLTESSRVRLLESSVELNGLNASVARLPTTNSIEPRTVHILTRGNWMNPTEEAISPGTLSCMPKPKTIDRRLNRLDLAQWLVSDSNPLTARVFVNRLWNQFFGNGLSSVLDDLGSQGEWPTHPDLLDWLAVEFVESGWDVKHMVRLITSSRAYQQSSSPRHDLAEIDPYNRLYARQYRARIDAELIRDNALGVSGLLNPAGGGRSVFPYQPEGYYAHTNTQTISRLGYETEENENQFRRGLYVIWKRSFLHPSLQAFDAPSREECTAQRPASNTPLQALVLLNDPTYVEAARAFAENIVRDGGATLETKLRWAFDRALLRSPTPSEIELLTKLYESHRLQYEADTESARALLTIGVHPVPKEDNLAEIAAWTSVARSLLNLHETVTRS